MQVERVTAYGERYWEPHLEGTTLHLGGLELDLDALSGPEPRRVPVYARGEEASLEPTDWLGAELHLPAREVEQVQVGEVVYETRLTPVNTELVLVRLFPLQVFGGEA
ncbi:hypothetical protein [Thermus scotoductus]|uniref:Uncharacterized protein n=1 Tax=Thermus scotoductus TaxID=37636 RepID=A0A430UVV7_THESC|nr:hypothetical protein [Thermus scotoductus]RTI13360.1 hypothetical protein CSW27_08550 [Thermus scotoductus]